MDLRTLFPRFAKASTLVQTLAQLSQGHRSDNPRVCQTPEPSIPRFRTNTHVECTKGPLLNQSGRTRFHSARINDLDVRHDILELVSTQEALLREHTRPFCGSMSHNHNLG